MCHKDAAELIGTATIVKDGLMPYLNSFVLREYNLLDSDVFLKIMSINNFQRVVALLSRGVNLNKGYNTAILIINNRHPTLISNSFRLNGTDILYYKFNGTNIDIYAKIKKNTYYSVELNILQHGNITIELQKESLSDEDLTQLTI